MCQHDHSCIWIILFSLNWKNVINLQALQGCFLNHKALNSLSYTPKQCIKTIIGPFTSLTMHLSFCLNPMSLVSILISLVALTVRCLSQMPLAMNIYIPKKVEPPKLEFLPICRPQSQAAESRQEELYPWVLQSVPQYLPTGFCSPFFVVMTILESATSIPSDYFIWSLLSSELQSLDSATSNPCCCFLWLHLSLELQALDSATTKKFVMEPSRRSLIRWSLMHSKALVVLEFGECSPTGNIWQVGGLNLDPW